MGIAVVPIVAFGDLFGAARLHLDDPQVRAPVIKPSSIVKLVRTVLVMPDIAALFARRATFSVAISVMVAWANAADYYQAIAVKRPAKVADSVLKVCNPFGLTALKGEHINL